jgi:hypothetical protein
MRHKNNKIVLGAIETVDDLKDYLYVAIQLEHATIPPYLTAMYSIHTGTNKDAYDLLRVIAVEEMLHLTLSANILNAIGGKPDLTAHDFVPDYPAFLPDGEKTFKVSLEKFSEDAIDTFLNIERPPRKHKSKQRLFNNDLLKITREKEVLIPAFYDKKGKEFHYYSIGEFYNAISEGLSKVAEKIGEDKLFSGEHNKQITEEYYYSGGGKIIPVYKLDDAIAAIQLISEQGEGHDGGIYDNEGELSHYYRFQQIKLKQYYLNGDEAGKPTGGPLEIDMDAVYPIKTNAKISDYRVGSELYKAAVGFNVFYTNFLQQLTKAYDGDPKSLIQAVGGMFKIKEMSYELMRNPILGDAEELTGAPTFEMNSMQKPANS